jgi:hypothetical protein
VDRCDVCAVICKLVWQRPLTSSVRPMRSALFFLLVLQANATAFDDRLARADAACLASGGKVYQQQTYEKFDTVANKLLAHCFGSVPSPDNSGFVIIAYVDAKGALSDLATRPATNLASCFVNSLSAVTFPVPPKGKLQGKFPIAINYDAVPIKSSLRLKCI